MRFRIIKFVALLLATTCLRADTLYIGSGGGVQYANAKVLRITGGQLVFNISSGEQRKPLDQVVRMQIDDEPVLTAAENAFVAEKWDQAVDGYSKIARATNKPWLKDWATYRLLNAAQKSNRFDAASKAYISMLLSDPDAAANNKPQLPGAGSTYLDSAIADTTAALNTKDITDKQKLPLLYFQQDLYKAKKDSAGDQKVAQQIDEILAKDPNNSAAGQAIARRSLSAAQRALDSKNYVQAISEIDAARANITESPQQADALFIVAEARYALANDKKDPTELKDAALAYMRVVANFKDISNHPHVPDSLLKTATIEEQLNDAPAAQQLYQQIVQQYPDDPAAGIARQKIQK